MRNLRESRTLLIVGILAIVGLGSAGAFTLTSCEGSADGNGSSGDAADSWDAVAAFVGEWVFTAGSVDLQCSAGTLEPNDPVGDRVTLSRASSNTVSLAFGACNVLLNVSGAMASSSGSTPCPELLAGVSTSARSVRIEAASNGRLTLTAQTVVSGRPAQAPDQLYECTMTTTGELERASPDR